MNWIAVGADVFNLDKIRHIWIEKGVNGYFLMGEFEIDEETVVLSGDFIDFIKCLNHLHEITIAKS